MDPINTVRAPKRSPMRSFCGHMILQADPMWSPGRLLMSLGSLMRLPEGPMISLGPKEVIDDPMRSSGELRK